MIELGKKSSAASALSKILNQTPAQSPESGDLPVTTSWPFDWDRRTRLYTDAETAPLPTAREGMGVWETLLGRRGGMDPQEARPSSEPSWVKALRADLTSAEEAKLESRFADAESYLLRANETIADQDNALACAWRATIACRHAMLLNHQDRNGDGERVLISAIEKLEASDQRGDASLASVYHCLGLTYREAGYAREAMMAFNTGLSLLANHQHHDQRAAMLLGRGLAATEQADHELAAASFIEGCQALDKHNAAPSRRKLEAKVGAAHALLKADRLIEAEDYCRQALEIRSLIMCDAHDEAALWNLLGFVLARRAKLDDAVKAYRAALKVLTDSSLPRMEDMANAHFNLATLYSAKNRAADSELHLRRAADIIDRETAIARARDEHFRKAFVQHFTGDKGFLDPQLLGQVMLYSPPVNAKK